MNTYNVRDFGATGKKAEIATPAMQKAVDACAEAGGGMVYVPPGEYTSGTIHLRSHVRFYLEAGATLYSSKNRADFSAKEDGREALFYGEDLQNISLEGRGTVDGQADYEWRVQDFDDRYIKENFDEFVKTGKKPMRAFPKKDQFGRLVLLLKCTDVRVEGLSFIRSPSWTMNCYACKRLVIDGVSIRSSLKSGVWADGIDPDGCSDVRISNCTIETGDDGIVFYSTPIWAWSRTRCRRHPFRWCSWRSARRCSRPDLCRLPTLPTSGWSGCRHRLSPGAGRHSSSWSRTGTG
jgi:polygalacturonase